jgi:acetylornithine deacetylase/succinyl-diaminopimelate desuccinylase-like protein
MSKYSPFERRHRTAARSSLYASALLSGLLVFALTRAFDTQLELTGERSGTRDYWETIATVRLLQRYIQIDTSGREIEGARFLASELRAAGLDPVVEELDDGAANVWAVIEGEDPQALVLHNHIDVFAADPEQWVLPPFSGLIEPPFLNGRGAFDMKSLAIAQLEAMRALAAAPGKPKMSVIFLGTAGEETGSELGTRWILRQHPELASRFAAVLTEGGVVEPVHVDDVKYWGIETAQKRFVSGEACAADREALDWLFKQIQRRRDAYQPPTITPEVTRFLASYAPTRQDDGLIASLDQIATGGFDPLRFRGFPRYLRSLFVNELIAFPVEEAEDGSYRLRLVIHLLPGADFEAVRAERLPAWMTHGLDVRFDRPLGSATGSPADSDLFRSLAKILEERHPGTPIGPHFLPWTATDARFFRQAGIPAYGFSPFLIFNTESYRADTINERINLPGFVAGVDLYVEAVRRLAAQTGL